jgi:hypothetical protein
VPYVGLSCNAPLGTLTSASFSSFPLQHIQEWYTVQHIEMRSLKLNCKVTWDYSKSKYSYMGFKYIHTKEYKETHIMQWKCLCTWLTCCLTKWIKECIPRKQNEPRVDGTLVTSHKTHTCWKLPTPSIKRHVLCNKSSYMRG